MKKGRLCLGIETSCDDTSVALVTEEGLVLKQLMASQVKGHRPFGGVVPELASRLHAEALLPLVDEVLNATSTRPEDLDLIAVSSRPGLIGSLLVGVVTAKTLALGWNKPLVGVNHIHGHIFSPFLQEQNEAPEAVDFPFLSLVVSGGHTHLYLARGFTDVKELGRTRDDAAGEAFDKFSNLLRLGFPGGPHVDRRAQGGDPKAYSFPRAMMKNENFEFSFSGLKAAAARLVEGLSHPLTEKVQADLCASFQEAVTDVLLHQLKKAWEKYGVKTLSISGGVSANSRLRQRAQEFCAEKALNLRIPPLKFCTDNAAMIAFAGGKRAEAGKFSDQSLTPSSSSLSGDFS